jgi:Flp pilus assembly pilin Flp
MKTLIRLLRDDEGQDLVEYALIVAAIGLALVAVVGQLSAAISSVYQSITAGLATIGSGGQ